MKLTTVPSYSKVTVFEDALHASPARSSDFLESMRKADTVVHHIHFVKEGYRLPDALHLLPEIIGKFEEHLLQMARESSGWSSV